MPTILLRLKGPMQSWGYSSRFTERDTGTEPSKSGVIGLVCAALGRDRTEPIDDLASIKMGVRVNKAGSVLRDFQTAGAQGGIMRANGKLKERSLLPSNRYYLADADFLVGLEHDDIQFLKIIYNALAAPVWPLYLGRKSYVPSVPILIRWGITKSGLMESLVNFVFLEEKGKKTKNKFIMEGSNYDDVLVQRTVNDQPVDFDKRQFRSRPISILYRDVETGERGKK